MATVLESHSSSESTTSSVYRSAEPVVSFAEAESLAGQFGTPLLVASRRRSLRNYEALRSSLPGVEFFYAAKANPAEADPASSVRSGFVGRRLFVRRDAGGPQSRFHSRHDDPHASLQDRAEPDELLRRGVAVVHVRQRQRDSRSWPGTLPTPACCCGWRSRRRRA